MRLFSCSNCHTTLHFDNSRCLSCQSPVALDPETMDMLALGDGDVPLVDGTPQGAPRNLCANAIHNACNWLAEDGEEFCLACRHNLVIPDLSVPENLENWQKIEAAKHMLFYSLQRFGLPMPPRDDAHPEGLALEFLSDDPALTNGQPVMTGHDRGLITLNIAEASDAEREARRVALGEPFRTLIGHFRHEVGHYYWNVLVRDAGRLEECRALFGNDEEDYGEALNRHYQQGPVAGWETSFISAYAASHPWEDFAECWAHYFHMVDALETAYAFGLKTNPDTDEDGLALDVNFDPYRVRSVKTLIRAWVPLTVAINGINRSMGQPDLYPFVVSDPVVAKLDFIHRLIAGR
ncbi:zinc-binding metallopeptidase family protein [Allorhizobium undicola]|uniref:zinc-binding metallopeptidase family protein n=1 Tax=Allorhizobium undicola TaxID=78527 RepID=UPI00048132E2|nr:putative zinc-binding metallopeptidase [Allorhizobium undicola]